MEENKKLENELKPQKKIKLIACKECGKTNETLIKATDSYYCKFCFDKLGKKKFEKRKNKCQLGFYEKLG